MKILRVFQYDLLVGGTHPFSVGRSFCFCRAKEECCRHTGCDFFVGFTTGRRGTGHLQFKSFAFVRFRKSWSLKRYQADLELSEEKELKDTVTFLVGGFKDFLFSPLFGEMI